MRQLSIVVVVLALAGLVWWLARDGEREPHGPAPAVAETPRAAPNDTVDAGAAALPGDAPAARTELAPPPADTPTTTPPTNLNATVIRGRCVDTSGAPIAAVKARLHGWVANQQRVDAYLRDHPPIEWRNPDPLTTGADGRFEFRITPPPPYQFALDLAPPNGVPMYGRWSTLAPAKVVDLGDVVFGGGVVVRGRVVDTNGAPREKVDIDLSRSDADRAEGMSMHWAAVAHSAADGTFAFAHSFAPGTWTLTVRKATKVTPKSDQVVLTAPAHVLDVVVEVAVPVVTIDGIVVDESGTPVRDADVEVVDTQRSGDSARTRRNGRFSIRRGGPETSSEKFSLHVYSDNHEPLETKAVHTFGEKDVRLVLRNGLPLEVIARRDADGAPVEHFSVRLLPKPGSRSRWTSTDSDVRGGHRHENGILRLTGVRRGPYFVVVEPAASTGLFGAYFVEANVADNAPSVVDVRLGPLAAQRVVVERADGTPVAGSEVELLLPTPGGSVTVDSHVQTFAMWFASNYQNVLRVDVATTAADGSCRLRGGTAPTFAVRVRGEKHITTLVADVRVGVADPLRIVVSSGATLVGRVTPVEAVADLRELAALPRTGQLTDAHARLAPSVQLQRPVERTEPRLGRVRTMERVPAMDAARLAVGEDGTFVIAGIPPGTWELQMTGFRVLGGMGDSVQIALHPGIAFADGETKELTFDVARERFGRLRATVVLDGVPYAGSVQMTQLDAGGRFGLTADAEGRLDALIPPGRWSASPGRRLSAQRFARFTPPEVATITPGEVTEVTFRAQSTQAKVRVLRADGAAAADVRLMVHDAASGNYLTADTTAADGTLEIWLAPGAYEVRAQDGSGGQVRLGDVTLPATAEVVLRLPK